MNCKKCGALLHEGDTFCRTCATPVQESYIKSNTNIATLDFSKVNKENSTVKVGKDTIDMGNDNNYITTKTKDINNKDLLDKDPNNKVKATIINISGLILLLIIVFILIILFLNVLSNLGK